MSGVWSANCGDKTLNPYCLDAVPTDPSHWKYLADPTLASTDPRQWTTSGAVSACTIDNYTGQKPNAKTGTCEASALSGPASQCVNPCIRVNGKLYVNKNAFECRVFPGATAGANPDPTLGCPTVCPSACVELWETCPPGTGPLTTLVHTKGAVDLMALTGPLRADGTLNPLFPNNYAANNYPANVLNANQWGQAYQTMPVTYGKPYTECYAYNTDFCEMPLARQMANPAYGPTNTGVDPYVCYAPCPTGTVQSIADPQLCVFATLAGAAGPSGPSGIGDGTTGPSGSSGPFFPATTVTQSIFCPPQYFTPAYSSNTGEGGIQIGCRAKPLAIKKGTTCMAGHTAYVNEQFTLEWCMPTCPTGYVQDLTHSTCIASCQGSDDSSSSDQDYNGFLDVVDFYGNGSRCMQTHITTANNVKVILEKDCAQDNQPGRCPARQYAPASSSDMGYVVGTLNALEDVAAVVVAYNSLNTSCQAYSAEEKTVRNNEQAIIKEYQDSNPTLSNGQPYVSCPEGMEIGDARCNENADLCYDKCDAGFEPVQVCSDGTLLDADKASAGSISCPMSKIAYVCRAKCPAPSEGYGVWEPRASAAAAWCEYRYPGPVPADPSLWQQCPDDGRYFNLSAATNGGVGKPPMCMRTQYMRQSTCPIGMNEVKGAATRCVQACGPDEALIVTVVNGKSVIKCQKGCSQDGRYATDPKAVVDTNAKEEFANRVCIRKNFAKGIGQDPQSGFKSASDAAAASRPAWLTPVYIVLGLLAALLLTRVLRR